MDSQTRCDCPDCIVFRLAGKNNGRRAPNCLMRNIALGPGGSKNQGGPSGGKAPPAIGGPCAEAAAVTVGVGQELAAIGNPSPGARTARVMGRAAVAATTAGGGQELANVLQRVATLDILPAGPGAPTPPRSPTWGFDGFEESKGSTPDERQESSPRSRQGRRADDTDGAGPTDHATERVVDMEDTDNYGLEFGLYEESVKHYVGESIETDSMASVSDDRRPVYIRGKDGRRKVRWPRKNGRKEFSNFAWLDFPFVPVDDDFFGHHRSSNMPVEQAKEGGSDKANNRDKGRVGDIKQDEPQDGESAVKVDQADVGDGDDDGHMADTERGA